LSDLTTRSERAEKEKADMQKKMAAYKQQYEDLLGSVSHNLKLISSCVEAEKCSAFAGKRMQGGWGGGELFVTSSGGRRLCIRRRKNQTNY
jgi:hypothetical protein